MTADVRGNPRPYIFLPHTVLRTLRGNIERSTGFLLGDTEQLMRLLGWPQAGPWRQEVYDSWRSLQFRLPAPDQKDR